MKKRWLSLLLCLSFVLALVPTAAMAGDDAADPLHPDDLYYSLAGESTDGEKPDITLHKTAVDNGDGTYDITLTAEAKEKVTIKDTEVVFVLDASSSMNMCEENLTTNTREHYHWNNNRCNLVEAGEKDSRWVQATNALHTVDKNLPSSVTKKYVYFNSGADTAADSSYAGVTTSVGTNLVAGAQ